MTFPAVILAAGAGARLGALGRQQSKAMLPIAGRPLIGWVIERLRAAGAQHLVVVRHAADAALAAWLREEHPGIARAEQRERHGIADAVRCALPLLAAEAAYLACACDSVFETADIAAVARAGREHPGTAVVGVLDMGIAATASRSAVRIVGRRIIEIVEKPDPRSAPSGLVGAPLYWLPRAVDPLLAATRLRAGERHVSSALNDFIAAGGKVLGMPLRGRIEVTTAEDVKRAEALLRQDASLSRTRRLPLPRGRGSG